jgi:hypothetical protein
MVCAMVRPRLHAGERGFAPHRSSPLLCRKNRLAMRRSAGLWSAPDRIRTCDLWFVDLMLGLRCRSEGRGAGGADPPEHAMPA